MYFGGTLIIFSFFQDAFNGLRTMFRCMGALASARCRTRIVFGRRSKGVGFLAGPTGRFRRLFNFLQIRTYDEFIRRR